MLRLILFYPYLHHSLCIFLIHQKAPQGAITIRRPSPVPCFATSKISSPHHRLPACEDDYRLAEGGHIVKKFKALICFKLIWIRAKAGCCPAMHAVEVAASRYLPCNKPRQIFFLLAFMFQHFLHNFAF